MSALDAVLGKVQNDGVEVELMGGLNFKPPLSATPNPVTKVIDIETDGTGGDAFPLAADVSAATHQIDNLGTPTNPNHAATKSYVDTAVAAVSGGTGAAPKADIVVQGTADSHSGLAARDGVTPVDGTVVLDVGHATPALRGYWVAHSGAWTRPTFYDSDSEVAALLGALVFIRTGGTLGGETSWQQTTGITIAGAKEYSEFKGNPDTVTGENGSITELGHDEGSGTGRLNSGSRYVKDISTTIGAGATATAWSFDGTALGLAATDLEGFAVNVFADWATDNKAAWAARAVFLRHGSPPTIIEKQSQTTLDGAAGVNGYITLDWDLSSNVLRLRVTNNRASALTLIGSINYLAGQVR